MNSEIADWVILTIKETQSDGRQLELADAKKIIDEAKIAYVEGNPRSW